MRNGLGSVRNLQLILGSIRVGQKGLYSAVVAVHADCAAMIASLEGLAEALVRRGTSPEAAQPVIAALHGCVSRLETALGAAVENRRLSAARRLALEQELPRLVEELGGALPLVALLDRSARPRPLESSPIALVHGSSVEGNSAGPSVEAVPAIFVAPSDVPEGSAISVDLAAAKALIVLGVALVAQRTLARPLEIRYVTRRGVSQTLIGFGSQSTAGAAVRIATLPLVEPALACAQVAARRLGGSFEFSMQPLQVCISWPLS